MVVWVLSFLINLSGLVTHDFHLSKSDVNYSSRDNALQISIHLFLDDLEAALTLEGHTQLGICTSKEVTYAEELIHEYIKDHFQLNLAGELLIPQWVGKEISDDLAGVWCYLEIPDIAGDGSFNIQNTLLVELFDDQRNIVKISTDHKRVNYFLMDVIDSERQFEL